MDKQVIQFILTRIRVNFITKFEKVPIVAPVTLGAFLLGTIIGGDFMRLLIIALLASTLVGCNQQEHHVDTDTDAIPVEENVSVADDADTLPDDTPEEQSLCEECGLDGGTGNWQGKKVCNSCWNKLHNEYVSEQLKHIDPIEVDEDQENKCAICGEGAFNYMDQVGKYFCDNHIGDYNDVDEIE